MTDQPPKTEHLQDDCPAIDQTIVGETETQEATAQQATQEPEPGQAEPALENPPGAEDDGTHAEVLAETSEASDSQPAIEETTGAPELAGTAESDNKAAPIAETAEAEVTPTDHSLDEPVRFEELALPEPLTRAITDLGFEECTPIQGRSLPFSLSDYDVTGQAQTGTGKTAAFLITLLTRFWENPHQERPNLGTPRALVLAPTRELVL